MEPTTQTAASMQTPSESRTGDEAEQLSIIYSPVQWDPTEEEYRYPLSRTVFLHEQERNAWDRAAGSRCNGLDQQAEIMRTFHRRHLKRMEDSKVKVGRSSAPRVFGGGAVGAQTLSASLMVLFSPSPRPSVRPASSST